MTEAPERIWAVHWNTDGAVLNGGWADTVRHFGGGVEYVRADTVNRENALQNLADAGQAADALDALVSDLVEALRECETEIDDYIRQEYPHDHPVQDRCRQRDYAANPARIALTAIRARTPIPTGDTPMTARDQLADRIVPILDPDALDPVAQELARNVADVVIGMVRAAVLAEREACAEVCDAEAKEARTHNCTTEAIGAVWAAESIRARPPIPD